MPSLNSVLAGPTLAVLQVANEQDRAVLAYRRILDRPTNVAVKRLTSTQIVRVEYHDLSHEEDGSNQTAGVAQATIFGVRNHPTVPDTDIKRGDRLTLHGSVFEVVTLMLPPGEVQALCEVRSG